MKSAKRISSNMLQDEKRAVFSLSGIISLRMFGLFMLLPILALYSESLPGNTPLLAGWALGIYGLTQALMQIPFGLLYGRIDPKLTIAIGLVIFALGSVLAGLADTIYQLIAGRALQGAGAVSAVVMALASDLTRNSQRTKAMALIGMSIGASFVLSLLIAPILQGWIGIHGMFWGIAGLAIFSIVILYAVVPAFKRKKKSYRQGPSVVSGLSSSLCNPQLLHMNLGIFLSHMALTALFLLVPSLFRDIILLPLEEHWKIYLLVLALSVPGLLLAIRVTSGGRNILRFYRSSIVVVAAGLMLLATGADAYPVGIVMALVIFFTGFNALESMMPSLASRMTSSSRRAGALSVYNTFQYIGIFCGGAVGGYVLDGYGQAGLSWCLTLIALTWLLLSLFQPSLSLRETLEVHFDRTHDYPADIIDRIEDLSGVDSVTLVHDRSLAYIEIDPGRYQTSELHKLLEK